MESKGIRHGDIENLAPPPNSTVNSAAPSQDNLDVAAGLRKPKNSFGKRPTPSPGRRRKLENRSSSLKVKQHKGERRQATSFNPLKEISEPPTPQLVKEDSHQEPVGEEKEQAKLKEQTQEKSDLEERIKKEIYIGDLADPVPESSGCQYREYGYSNHVQRFDTVTGGRLKLDGCVLHFKVLLTNATYTEMSGHGFYAFYDTVIDIFKIDTPEVFLTSKRSKNAINLLLKYAFERRSEFKCMWVRPTHPLAQKYLEQTAATTDRGIWTTVEFASTPRGKVVEARRKKLAKMKNKTLSELCSNYGLPKTGRKACLIERVLAHESRQLTWQHEKERHCVKNYGWGCDGCAMCLPQSCNWQRLAYG